jgi:hypothetical protein
LFVEPGDHLGDELVEGVQYDLALMLADDLALGINEHQGRPGPDRVAFPDIEIVVVDDRVADFISEYRLTHAARGLLCGEFGRVDTDHHHLRGVLPLQFPQLRKYVHVVDSAVCPEIDHHHLSL